MVHPPDTSLGGAARHFPSTIWELVERARDPRNPLARESLDTLICAYWKPVYTYIRLSWGKTNEEAKDLTQGFFLELVERNLLGQFDHRNFRLRVSLKTALQHFLIDEKRREEALKRGGDLKVLPLDRALEDVERMAATGERPEEAFDRAWLASIVQDAMTELRVRLEAEGRGLQYELLKRAAESEERGTPLSYAELARTLAIGEQDVANHLHRARAKLRGIVVERLRRDVGSLDDMQAELRDLFGATDV